MSRPSIFKILKYSFLYILIFCSFLTMFFYNIHVVFFSPNPYKSFKLYQKVKEGGPLSRVYAHIIHFGNWIKIGTVWRMYSPGWRKIYLVKFYGLNSNGEFVYINMPNLSKTYRKERGLLRTFFFDFKLATTLSSVYQSKWQRKQYINYYCREEFLKMLGWKPSAIKFVIEESIMPGPDRKGDWTPLSDSLDTVVIEKTYACP